MTPSLHHELAKSLAIGRGHAAGLADHGRVSRDITGALGSTSPIGRSGTSHTPSSFIRNISVWPHAQLLMSISDPHPNLCSIREVIDVVGNVARGRDQFCSVDSPNVVERVGTAQCAGDFEAVASLSGRDSQR